jgi:hypothetical protein
MVHHHDEWSHAPTGRIDIGEVGVQALGVLINVNLRSILVLMGGSTRVVDIEREMDQIIL